MWAWSRLNLHDPATQVLSTPKERCRQSRPHRRAGAETSLVDLLHCMSPEVCRFLDAGNNETLRTLSGPASKKRQGTKSREIGHWLAASAMGISCWRRSRLWAGRPHNASCMSARTRGRESAVGISAGARSASTGDRRTGGCDGVERDRRGRGPSASERESRDAHKMSGS
jgi:hypothetical protein